VTARQTWCLGILFVLLVVGGRTSPPSWISAEPCAPSTWACVPTQTSCCAISGRCGLREPADERPAASPGRPGARRVRSASLPTDGHRTAFRLLTCKCLLPVLSENQGWIHRSCSEPFSLVQICFFGDQDDDTGLARAGHWQGFDRDAIVLVRQQFP
jgi:hypothetical protein